MRSTGLGSVRGHDEMVRRATQKLIHGGDFISPPAPKKQAIALIFGMPGHGKTTLGLRYAPSPVAFFDIDRRGLHAARAAMKAGQVINYLSVQSPVKILRMSDRELIRMAEAEIGKVRKNYELALREAEKGNIRTIVFDTMSEFGSLINMATTGRSDRKKDDYGRSTDIVKTALSDFIRACRGTPANLIMLAKAKPIWEAGEPSGEFSFRGYDTMDYDADWSGHIRLKKVRSIKQARSEVGRHHELQITKAGLRLKTLGAVYTDEEWGTDGPFVYACVQQFRGSKPEDWK